MGETAELRNRQAGTFGFNDFITQGDGRATIQKMFRVMLPTVDMRDFQRRYRFSSGSQDLLIGERLTLAFTVPANEYWRPRTFMFTNKDSTEKVIQVQFTIDNTGTNIYQAVQTRVASGTSQVVYGQDLDGAVGAVVGRFTSRLPSIMEPADVMTVVQTQAVTIASEQSWILIYELVPAPAESLVRGIAAGVTVI